MKKKNLYHDESMWKGAPSDHFGRAKKLRENMTEAEKLLWENLKAGKFQKYKFRRQHPIHTFIVDFYSHKLSLAIEVDGEYHEVESQKVKDIERTELLQFQGLSIIRFTNEEVLGKSDQVLKTIEKKIYEIEQKIFPDSLYL